MATKVVFITTTGAGTFTVPSDFGSLISVEAIGGGGSSGGSGAGAGAGGGAYAKSTWMILSANQPCYYRVGIGGGTTTSGVGTAHSWFNPTTNSPPTVNLSSGITGVLAAGGFSSTSGTGSSGGTVALSTGDTRNAGGNGGTTAIGSNAGGGGAAGPGGVGGTGGTNSGSAGAPYAGGGGSGATLSAAGTNGVSGTGTAGAGGASSGQTAGTAGTAGSGVGGVGANGGGGGGGYGNGNIGGNGGVGSYWTATNSWNGTTLSNSVATGGSGGGAGGLGGGIVSGNNGGLYGGGGGGNSGVGAQGIIVFTYNPSTNSGFKKSDDIFGTIDLDDQYVTDQWLVDQFVGGTLFSWGNNGQGQMGINIVTSGVYYSSPVQVGSLTNWKQVSGSISKFAIKTDGTLWAWGNNTYGGLGNNNRTNYSSPIQIGALTNWKQVSGGSDFCAAIKADGTLWTWGANVRGSLGQNFSTFNYYSSPVQVGSLTNWKQVSRPGQATTVQVFTIAATKTDGTLWTWGANITGSMGIDTVATQYYSSPVQVGALNNWKQVSSSGFGIRGAACAAVKTDGTLWGWGSNVYGTIGINCSGNYYSSPVQVGSLTNWKQVSLSGQDPVGVGGGLACCAAIKTDGTLWTWGGNNVGQLGINSSGNYYSSPVQVGALTNWKQIVIANNGRLMHAIKTDGTLWTWGANDNGGSGVGTSGGYYSSPIQIGALTNWKYIGDNHYSSGATYSTISVLTFSDLT